MAWNPTSVAYGIRHARLFGVLRSAGDAIDAVLALQGTGSVPRKCFTRIGWPEPITTQIVDDDQNFVLTITIDGIVLTVNLREIKFTRANARDMFTDIVSAALPITDPGRRVNRIGVVETYDFSQIEPGQVAATALTRLANVGTPTDFAFQAAFRRLLTTGEADWWNTILQVAAIKRDEDSESPDLLRVSIDCQQYFLPDRVFTPATVREHYIRFSEEAEALQHNQLAGLSATAFPVNLVNG